MRKHLTLSEYGNYGNIMTATRLLDSVRHAVRVRQSGFLEIAHLPMKVVCTAARHSSASTPLVGCLTGVPWQGRLLMPEEERPLQ